MGFFVYVLEDEETGRFYVGQTADIANRLSRHNHGRNLSTKHGHWSLVHTEEYATRADAVRRERELKSWKSHNRLAELVRASR